MNVRASRGRHCIVLCQPTGYQRSLPTLATVYRAYQVLAPMLWYSRLFGCGDWDDLGARLAMITTLEVFAAGTVGAIAR